MSEALVFGLPVYESVPGLSLPSLLQAAGMGRWIVQMTTSVAVARNRIVQAFMEVEGDFLVFLDADMIFKPGDVERLVKKLEQAPTWGALAAYYVKRDGSGLPVVHWKNGDGWIMDAGRIRRAAEHREAGEVAYVDSFGGGLMVTHRGALQKVGYPWFQETQLEDGPEGNDTYFCRRLQEEGFTPAVDFGVALGHVGQGIFRGGRVEEAMHGPS